MKTYPAYKGTQIEWISSIPNDWIVSRLKYVANIFGRIGFRGYTKEDLVPEGEGALTIGGKHIQNNRLDLSDPEFISWEKYYESPEIMIASGDILITQRGSLGKIVLIENEIGPATINPSVVLLKNIQTNRKFLYYFLSCDFIVKVVELINSTTAVPMISQSQIGSFPIVTPPLPEQQAIANYLDSKTAQIDDLIAKKQRQIDLLHEQRTALINQAVTKGLNPDAPMKDSGVEWLGEIPNHWKVKRFKYCSTIKSGQVDPRQEPYKSMILIAPNHIKSITGRLLETQTADEQGAESGKYLYEKGDVLYSKIRPELRKACLSVGVGLCSADMYPIKPTDDLLAEFLLYLLLSNPFSLYATERSMRVAMPKVNREALNEYSFAYPEITEQQKILDYIKTQPEKTDTAIDKAAHQIAFLQEYRTALISAAVTGKIDVREG